MAAEYEPNRNGACLFGSREALIGVGAEAHDCARTTNSTSAFKHSAGHPDHIRRSVAESRRWAGRSTFLADKARPGERANAATPQHTRWRSVWCMNLLQCPSRIVPSRASRAALQAGPG